VLIGKYMRVSQTNSENRNFSVPKAGIAGAALGYIGTYAVPLTTEEHARYFTQSVKDNINAKVVGARMSEIGVIRDEIKSGAIKPLAADLFEKSVDALSNHPKDVIKDLHKQTGLDESVRSTVNGLFKRVYNSGKITKITENAKVSWAAKKAGRAGLYYAGIGALVLMTLAVLKNSIDTFFPKKPQKPAVNPAPHKMTDADYIIECAEGPAEIYIYGFGGAAKNKPGA